MSVAFWNLVGAGLFGFMINPPVALYFMQGLNTTAVHGHTALFGVYGMLGIGLMLFDGRVGKIADKRVFVIRYVPLSRSWVRLGERTAIYLGDS